MSSICLRLSTYVYFHMWANAGTLTHSRTARRHIVAMDEKKIHFHGSKNILVTRTCFVCVNLVWIENLVYGPEA